MIIVYIFIMDDEKELRRELKMISRSSKKLKSGERGRIRRGGGRSPVWWFGSDMSIAQNKLIRNADNKVKDMDFAPNDIIKTKVNTKYLIRCNR